MTAINQINGNGFAGSITDPTKHAQVYQYLEALKKDENGWKKSTDNIITNNFSNVEEHFLLLQVVEDYLSKRYAQATPEAVMCIRSLLSHWIQKIGSTPDQPVFLVNKMAHIFSLVFAADFPERWPTFMSDIFLSRGFDSVPFVIFYLKTVLAIDAEVVDRDIQRTQQLFERNTKIKDCMREICIKQMVQSWWEILEGCSDVTAQSLCLDAVAAFVDWIDVELVANDVFVPLVIARLSNKDLSEAAVGAVSALIQKGMPASKKLGLVLALSSVLHSNNLLAVNADTDYDDVLRAGSLLNSMGLVLLDCYAKLKAENSSEEAASCITALEADFDVCLAVLDNEDTELSELIVDLLRAYVLIIRDDNTMDHNTAMARIVTVCLRRYAMSESLDIDGEGEDELDFHEHRKNLRSLMNAIGVKRPDLIVEPLETEIAEVRRTGQSMVVSRLEAIIQLVYSLSEIIPSSFVQMKEGWLGRAAQLPISLLEVFPLNGRSAVTHVLFFETACRYERLLAAHPQTVVPLVAAAFLDERGIAFRVSKVRTRMVYLFCRFVKAHKAVLSPLVSEVIGRLAPLLAVSPQSEQLITADDQAFIFEATATLIVFGDLPVAQKTQYIEELATTLASKFQTAAQELTSARSRGDAPTQQLIMQFMTSIVGYCSRMSKAFNSNQSMVNSGCVEIFLRLLNLFLEQLTPNNEFLLESTRQLGHRMVVCLDTEIAPILPTLMNKIANISNDLDSMNHLLILTHQIVAKHKKAILSFGVDFVAIVTAAARLSMDPNATVEASRVQGDEAAQRALVYVQRAYLQLLYTITTNDMLNELASSEVVDGLLDAATRLALGDDQSSQKLAMSTLARAAVNSPVWWERTIRTALQVPSLPHISPADAGSTIVVHEVSQCLISLQAARPPEFALALQSLLPEELTQQLLSYLAEYKGKELDKQIMNMYVRIRNAQQGQA